MEEKTDHVIRRKTCCNNGSRNQTCCVKPRGVCFFIEMTLKLFYCFYCRANIHHILPRPGHKHPVITQRVSVSVTGAAPASGDASGPERWRENNLLLCRKHAALRSFRKRRRIQRVWFSWLQTLLHRLLRRCADGAVLPSGVNKVDPI